MQKTVPILVKEKRRELRKDRQGREYLYTKAAAYVPGVVDLQKQWASEEVVANACHDFMEKHQNVGFHHKAMLSKSDVVLVENYLSDKVCEIGGTTFPKGTWFQAHKVFAPELIKLIESGQITGLSIGGNGTVDPNKLTPP